MSKALHHLQLQINKEPYPYNKEQGKEGNWAHIKLDIVYQNKLIYNVVDVRWYPLEFLEWFFVNQHKIETDELKLKNQGSIAETICNYYEEDSCYTKVDYLFGYRVTHCIGYGLKGITHIEAYIGKNNEGYELSIKTKDDNLKYLIDLPLFFKEIEKLAKTFY